MNILLWVIQVALALLFFAGGATKLFKFDELAKMPANRVLSRGGWKLVGVVEVLGAVMLIVPGAVKWMPTMTPLAAAVLAVESLTLAANYARYSLKVAATNPLVWSAAMGVLAVIVAFGRYALSPLVAAGWPNPMYMIG
jgi:uncharacterized membrane protein YphA (DoxX/SURF4 family)